MGPFFRWRYHGSPKNLLKREKLEGEVCVVCREREGGGESTHKLRGVSFVAFQ